MQRSDSVAEGLDSERQALLDQLRAAEQVSCCLCPGSAPWAKAPQRRDGRMQAGKELCLHAYLGLCAHSLTHGCSHAGVLASCRCGLSWSAPGRDCRGSWPMRRAVLGFCKHAWAMHNPMQKRCGSELGWSRPG
jgi:hypothetical protein